MVAINYRRHYPWTAGERTAWLFAGFVFGALAVLVFHQGAFALLHSIGFTPRAPYSMQATAPWGLPQVWSTMFWGGVWGVLLAATVHRLERGALIFAATLFGMIVPTLAAWFIVAALKGQPLAAGLDPKGMALGLIVNAAWGLGVGIGLAVLGKARAIR
jgi:hypothetical protein